MDPRVAVAAVLVFATTCSAGRQHHQFTGPSGLGFPTGLDECDPDMVGFELVTGVVYTAPTDLLDSLTGVLMLTDCLEACQGNDSCEAINFETGLCVLFSSSADSNPGSLTRSQYPVFTIYAQKSCLGVKPCERAWCFDRVTSYKLEGHAKKRHTASSRQDCLELCLGEREFPCRSANYNNATRECTLSDMDRTTVAGSGSYRKTEQSDWDYLENNCVDEPAKLCEFRKLRGRILKTVDSVYQDVGSADDCRELCLNSPFRCRSYDYGDTGDTVCRLSHHSRATLVDVAEPYLNVPEAATYELSSCYNVTVDCRAGDMVARVKTSRLFTGKIYAKGAPNSCVQDVVDGSMEFELQMGYDDLECNVKQQGLGRYLNDVVIQHHDTIVTSSDLGLAVTCQYDLTNKSVSNEVDLGVRGDVRPALTEEVIVDSPSVAMKITDRTGSSDLLSSAEVGDPLALRFEILDRNSPYEIFVRELVAMDGVDSSEIVLIDSDGCPTDQFIMGPVYRSGDSAKVLLSHFDAFKFPSSEMVQFRALVTPCMPTCEPVQCDQEDPSGELRSIQSLGRRRRRRRHTAASQSSAREDLLLVQSIQITDKFGFNQQHKNTSENGRSVIYDDIVDSAGGYCMNLTSIIVPGIVLLLAQLAIIACWTFTWQRQRRKMSHMQNHHLTLSLPNVVRTDSLCKLYESGYARRF